MRERDGDARAQVHEAATKAEGRRHEAARKAEGTREDVSKRDGRNTDSLAFGGFVLTRFARSFFRRAPKPPKIMRRSKRGVIFFCYQ